MPPRSRQAHYRWQAEPSYGLLVSAIENANCALVARDLEGRIVFMNRRALEWVGYGPQEVEGQSATCSSRGAAPRARGRVRDGLAATAGSPRRLPPQGRPDLPGGVGAAALRNEAGKLVGTISVVLELASVQTAKRWAVPAHGDFAETLQRIAGELEAISLVATGSAPASGSIIPTCSTLSEREREILSELAAGSRVPSIATKLFISPHTVRNHLKAIYRKLGVSSQAELVERLRGAPPKAPEPGCQ